MKVWFKHVKNDSNKKRSRFVTPETEGEGCHGGHVSLRLSNGRHSSQRGAAISNGASGEAEKPYTGCSKDPTRRSDSKRAGFTLIVVDASAVLEVLLRSQIGLEIENRIFSPQETLYAPHLLDLEVAQVVRRYCAFGEIDSERGKEAIEDLKDLPINRYPRDIFLHRVWELRHNMTAYDAVYVTEAETLPAPHLTRDAHLASAPGHEALIELI